MGEWKEYKLGELFLESNQGVNTTTEKVKYSESGFMIIRAKNIFEYKIDFEDVVHVTEETFTNLKDSVKPKLGDVLFTNIGSQLGSAAVVKKSEPFAIAWNVFRITSKKNLLDSLFLMYFLNNPETKNFIRNLDSSSTMPFVSGGVIRSLEFTIPPLPEQTAIATVLSSLDDKIDLLHRQNITLDKMAETLFRQWFVEEAKEDWEVVSVGQFVKTNLQTITKDYNFLQIEYLDTSSLNAGKFDSTQSISLKDAPSRAKRLVNHNDILISTVRPDQRHYGIVNNPIENLVVSTGFCVINCKTINPYFVYLLLTSEEMTEYLHSIAEGSTSTYPSLKPSDIEKIEFQKPPKEKIESFGIIASSMWNKINYNHKQINTLTKLRNTLLPKLMSGEVRVKYSYYELQT